MTKPTRGEWKAVFSPPPPSALTRTKQPAGEDTNEDVDRETDLPEVEVAPPDVEPLAASDQDDAESYRAARDAWDESTTAARPGRAATERTERARRPRPTPVDSTTAASRRLAPTRPRRNEEQVLTGLPAREREYALAVADILRDSGRAGRVEHARRRTGSTVLEIADVDPVDSELAEDLAEELMDRLPIAQARPLPPLAAGSIRIELFPDQAAAERSKQYVVYVPIEIRDAVMDAKDDDESVTEFFLTAFNEHYEALPELFTPRRDASQGPMPHVRKTRRRKGVADPVQMWLYLSPEQRDTFDDAIDQFNAANRSALATKLFEREIDARLREA